MCSGKCEICSMKCAVCSLQCAVQCVIYTRRYGPLRGLTSSSCGGLWPSVEAFLALRATKGLIVLFCSGKMNLIYMSNIGFFLLKSAVCSLQYAVSSKQCTVFSMECAVCSVQFAVSSVHYEVCSFQ